MKLEKNWFRGLAQGVNKRLQKANKKNFQMFSPAFHFDFGTIWPDYTNAEEGLGTALRCYEIPISYLKIEMAISRRQIELAPSGWAH